MFARTARLLLRPGWIEDAPALADAIRHESITAHLADARWPVGHADTERWLKRPQNPALPNLLVFSRTAESPRLVGGVGLHKTQDNMMEIDFWISPQARNRGFATEAGKAMLNMAASIGIARLTACVFSDGGPAVHVLEKLGFVFLDKAARRLAGRDALIPATRFIRRISATTDGRLPLLAA